MGISEQMSAFQWVIVYANINLYTASRFFWPRCIDMMRGLSSFQNRVYLCQVRRTRRREPPPSAMRVVMAICGMFEELG
jgi:hypothetical protein